MTLLSRRLDSQSSILNQAIHTIAQADKTSSTHQQLILQQQNKITEQQNIITAQQNTIIQHENTIKILSETNITDNETLKEQAEQLTIFFILLHNIKQIIPTLKKKIKYDMMRRVINGITREDVRRYLSIPLITVRRIMQQVKRPKLIVRRKREMRIILAKRILSDLVPMVSGRNYRIQLMTTKELYKRYCGEVKRVGNQENGTDLPLSSTRIWKILKLWPIRHTKDVSQCPHCKLIADYGNGQPPPPNLLADALVKWRKKNGDTPPPVNLEQKIVQKWRNKLERLKATHKQIAQAQHRSHKQAKKELIASKSPNKMILLQDFTQLNPQSGFNQDMIITTMRYDDNEVDKIKRDYYHFIGSQGDHNNQCFVMAVWEYLLTTKTIITNNINNIEIWSDGGAKHFKCKETMFYFSTIQARYNKIITYNFYQSHHGHNSCDAAASHAKKAIQQGQANTGVLCYTVFDMANYINTVKNHHAQPVPQFQTTNLKVSKIDGIQSYFKFSFPDRGQVAVFNSSADVIPAKVYNQKVTLFPF